MLHLENLGSMLDKLTARFVGGPWSAHIAARTSSRQFGWESVTPNHTTTSVLDTVPPKARTV